VPTSAPVAAGAPPAGSAPSAAPAESAPQATAARAASTTTVAVALPVPSQSFLPIYLAREKGYYAEEGIDADIQIVAPQLGVQGVVAGNYGFSGAVSQAAIAGLTGAPVRVVFNTHSITWWLMANQASGVRTIPDLKGKVIGIEGPGTLSATFTRVLLRQHGLNPDADVPYASLGPVPNWLQGAIGGAVDAAIAGDVDLRLLGEGQGLTEVAWYGQDVQGSLIGLATSESMLRGNADLTRRFLRAANRALNSYRANKDDTVALGARLLDQSPDFVGRAYDLSASLLLSPPMLAPDVQREFLDLAKETLSIDRAVDPSEVFDYDLARQVVQEAGTPPARP
jgi:ABC-type nitrate/sulfonate/bicarbonate transport system substrate-binding protein